MTQPDRNSDRRLRWLSTASLLGVLCLSSPVASAADDIFCAGYAQTAVDQYRAAVAVAACGPLMAAEPARWSADRDYHRRWCLRPGTTQAAAEAEERARRDLLRRCRGEAPIVEECERYARQAVAQQHENEARACRFDTSAWSDVYDHHYDWCVRVGDRKRVAAETAERRRMLDQACPTGRGDLAAHSWCYEIDEPGPGQTVTITFHPIVKNVGSRDWHSLRKGNVVAEVNVGPLHQLARHDLLGFPNWSIKAGESKRLPGVTVPFTPTNTYTSHGSWTLAHPDDTDAANNRLNTPGVATGVDFLPAAPPGRPYDGSLYYRTCSKAMPVGTCDAYADLAVAQDAENRAKRCGHGRPKWAADRAYHRAWCERPNVSIGGLIAESVHRSEELARCSANRWAGAVPVQVAVEGVHCVEETDEVDSDEPYVLAVAIDGLSGVPQVEVTRYGPYDDVDSGETHREPPTRPAFWAPDRRSRRFTPANAALVLVLMENDDGDPEAARTVAKAAVVAALASSVGLGRALRVQKVVDDLNSALGIPTGAPSFDERVGSAQEVKPQPADLFFPWLGPPETVLRFKGDGGEYEVFVSFVDP